MQPNSRWLFASLPRYFNNLNTHAIDTPQFAGMA